MSGFLNLPGGSGNNCTAPDAANLHVTGNIYVMACLAMNDWTPAAAQNVLTKWQTSGQFCFVLQVSGGSTGGIAWIWSTTGSDFPSIAFGTAPTVVDGAALWLAVTFQPNDGAAHRVGKLWTAGGSIAGPGTWTQVGATVTQNTASSIFAGTSKVEIGSQNNGTSTLLTGKVYYAEYGTGLTIGAAPVSAVDFRSQTKGATSVADGQGHTYTVNGTADVRGTQAMTASTAGAATTTAAEKVAHSLVGTSVGASTDSALTKVAHSLAGGIAGSATSAGTDWVAHVLAGTEDGISTVAAALRETLALSGSFAGLGSANARAAVAYALTVMTSAQAGAQALLVIAEHPIGLTGGMSGATGSLVDQLGIVSSADAVSSAVARLRLAESLGMVSSGAISSAVAAARVRHAFEASTSGVSTAWALLALGEHYVGLTQGKATASGSLGVARALAGLTASASLSSATLGVARHLIGVAHGVSGTMAGLGFARYLQFELGPVQTKWHATEPDSKWKPERLDVKWYPRNVESKWEADQPDVKWRVRETVSV